MPERKIIFHRARKARRTGRPRRKAVHRSRASRRTTARKAASTRRAVVWPQEAAYISEE